ncbi:MAG: family protein phosphatase [Actinomycetota bacterium]|jgi:protein phosphatase|nr:family protein phosphatase [Actinomycetota bacterium]
MNVRVGARSDVGRVREANEDSYLIDEPLYVVADGMGGHLAGDVASDTAVKTIKSGADASAPDGPDALIQLVRDANKKIWERSQSDASLRGMGTTTTLVLVEGEEAHLAHVGDSRAYLFRDGDLSQITEDHTLVGRMVREGRLRPEEAERHPQRSIITRALGVDSDVDVDTITLRLQEGDRILINSDGLTSMLSEPQIRDVLASEPDPQRAADRLVELANEAGGEDNITVLILDFGEGNRDTGVASAGAEQPPVPREPMRFDTPPVERSPAVTTGVIRTESLELRKRRWPRALALTLVLLAVLGGAAYFGTRYLLSNSYFVGADEEGYVTIFKGRPEEIAGMSLRESEEQTTLKVADLPQFLRGDVEEGIKVDSLEEAQNRVTELEDRAGDAEFGGTGTKKDGPN